MYYKAKVKCRIEQDNGKIQKVTEEYLVEAVCVTDVEAIVTQKYQGVTFEWIITSVSETKITEILDAYTNKGIRV